MVNNRRLEEIRKKENKARYENQIKNLVFFPVITAIISIIVLVMFSMEWAAIYNTGIQGNEVEFSGFNALIATITDGWQKTGESLGDVAVPFYYYAKDYCENLGALTVSAFVVVALELVVAIITLISKKHKLNIVAAALGVIAFVLLIAAYSVAFSMNDSKILPIYCSENPECSINSAIILPALVALVSVVPSVVAFVKQILAEKIIK